MPYDVYERVTRSRSISQAVIGSAPYSWCIGAFIGTTIAGRVVPVAAVAAGGAGGAGLHTPRSRPGIAGERQLVSVDCRSAPIHKLTGTISDLDRRDERAMSTIERGK